MAKSSSLRERKQKKKNAAKNSTPPDSKQQRNQPAGKSLRSLLFFGSVAALVLFAAAAIPLWRRIRSTHRISPSQEQEQKQAADTSAFSKEDPPIFTKIGTFELLETVAHDPKAFTQGFVTIQDNGGLKRIYEGTGMWGDSELRLLDSMNGNTALDKHELPQKYFGEGIAHYPLDEGYGLVQLTWKAKTAFHYVIPTFSHEIAAPTSNFTYTTTTGQGWGITFDPVEKVFWVSDGSAYLHKWHNVTYSEILKIKVTYQLPHQTTPQPLSHLNELEWDPVTQTILANVYGQDIIARIDPKTGFVGVVYDCGTLFENRPASADVFNGIALTYDLFREIKNDNQVWVTGKYWPHTYRIRLVEPQEQTVLQ